MLVPDMAVIVSPLKLHAAVDRTGRTGIPDQLELPVRDGEGKGSVRMEGQIVGARSHDLEVSVPCVGGVLGDGLLVDMDGSGEPVDEDVPLGLSVGVHGDEGGGFFCRGVVHDRN